MAYRVNGILYRLRFLRLPYENSFAKTLGLVLAVLREIFGILLGKLLYMAVFFAAPLLLIRRELPPELYGHLLVFLTLIGGIFNNNLLNGGRDAYYAVILLRMDARRYTLSAYGYYLLKTAVGFLAAALLVGHLILRQGLALCWCAASSSSPRDWSCGISTDGVSCPGTKRGFPCCREPPFFCWRRRICPLSC